MVTYESSVLEEHGSPLFRLSLYPGDVDRTACRSGGGDIHLTAEYTTKGRIPDTEWSGNQVLYETWTHGTSSLHTARPKCQSSGSVAYRTYTPLLYCSMHCGHEQRQRGHIEDVAAAVVVLLPTYSERHLVCDLASSFELDRALWLGKCRAESNRSGLSIA